MLVDDITVRLEAGAGGRGAKAFSKVRLVRGPTGGDGGRGGSFYFEGVSDINALSFYSGRKVIRAKKGGDGRGQFIDGKNGEDMILKVPTGTRITNVDTGYTREISEVGERMLVAGGGTGGRGNFKFRSSTNTTPQEFEEGAPGDSATFHLELSLIADVGFIGLPNAGKSSLLNEITNAKSKIAGYAFTTLEPHLGAYHGGVIIADIPGLIEGASGGKGLGVKFLKHIERTKKLFHLVSAESDDAVRDYKIVRAEMGNYNPELIQKQEHVFLTKCDAVPQEAVDEALARLAEKGIHAAPISILDPASLKVVKECLSQ